MVEKNKPSPGDFLELDSSQQSPTTLSVLNALRAKIKGQDRALEYVADAWELYKAGMRNPEKPIFVGLFLGPSGVGKTRSVEVLAEHFFGKPDAFIKVRCAEYIHGHEASRLTGAPPGYIGHVDNKEDPWAEQKLLPVSQFNIDKFDFFQRLRTGELLEEINNSLASEDDGLISLVVYFERQIRNLKDSKKQDEKTQKEIKSLQEEVKKLKGLLEAGIKTNAQFLVRLKKTLPESLKKETLLYLWSMLNQKTKFTSIILFDEVEKAHFDFHKHLLEIMDRGSLGVGSGETSFKNSFVFMTSNVGSKEIARILSGDDGNTMGFQQAVSGKSVLEDSEELDKKLYKAAIDAAEEFFTPEFLGRIDKIVVFRPLPKEILSEIFDLELSNFNQRNLTQAILPIVVRFTEAAKNYVLDSAIQHNSYGARMIEKKLDRTLKVGLARLANKKNSPIVPGDVIWVDWNGEKVIFKKEIIEKDQTIIIG